MTDATNTPRNESAQDLPEQARIRRDKRTRILESGKDAYPVEVPRTHSLAEVRARWKCCQRRAMKGMRPASSVKKA